jgi:ElaB/YqjD/DUF883 family membrane-anchored ribosome-binding protein
MEQSRKLNELFNDTEELLAELQDQEGPGIQELRDKLERSISRTRTALSARPAAGQVKLRDVAGSFNDYVKHYPWMALATGVLIASAVGIMATSATKRSLNS